MTGYRRNIIKLPKGARTLSGEIIAGRHGSDILDDLMKWLNEYEDTELFDVGIIKDKIMEIEKSYGVDRIE